MEDLATLLAHPGAPGLIHLHHPHHPSSAIRPDFPERCKVVRLDAVEHHTQRLVYAGALSRLASAMGKEAEKERDRDGREVLSWDVFARGLRALWTTYTGKGKGRARKEEDEGQIVLLVTKAERLKSVLGAEWTAMTRLAELVSLLHVGRKLTTDWYTSDSCPLLPDAVGRPAACSWRCARASARLP